VRPEPPATTWLIVSKPLRPPWRDGATVLARDLVAGVGPRFALHYFGDPTRPLRETGRVLPASPMGYSPRLRDKARVLAAILRPGEVRLPLHFFFSQNRVTSTVLAALRRAQPRRPVVQTVPASEGVAAWARWLRPLDAVVVVSERGRRALAAAGLPPGKVVHIPPGVALPAAAPEAEPPPRLLYAGDVDAAVAAHLLALADELRSGPLAEWRLTLALRPKDPEQARQAARLRERLAGEDRVEVLGEVADMDALLRATSLQLFLATHTRRKVDIPLVLLEGLARGVGVVAWAGSPARELFDRADALGLQVGARVPPGDGAALRAAVRRVAGSASLRLDLREAARELVARAFPLAAMTRSYEQLYARLAGRRTR